MPEGRIADIIKPEEGLVVIVKSFADNLVQTAVSVEELKLMPFVEAGMSITRIVTGMANTLVAGLQKPETYCARPRGSNLDDNNISLYANPEGKLKVSTDSFKCIIYTKEGAVKIRQAYHIGYGTPESVFERLEPKFIRGDDTAVRFFTQYSLLPQKLAVFAQKLREEAEQRKVLLNQAYQTCDVPAVLSGVEDPLEEKFKLLEGAK